jgi:uncharacterized protein with PQ loop repeat
MNKILCCLKFKSFNRKQVIGWIGAFAFALCGLPQAIRSIEDGHSNGLEWGFLLLWVLGEFCAVYFVWDDKKKLSPFFFNYVVNIIFVGIIIFYKIFPQVS